MYPVLDHRLPKLALRLCLVPATALAIAACGGGVGPVGGDAGADSSAATGGASCTRDPDCNNDPSLSSLLGACTSGVCVCNPGIVSASNGKCGAWDGSTPSNCEARGGRCFGLGGGTPPPASYRPANAGEATCGSYPGTNGGSDTGCFFLK